MFLILSLGSLSNDDGDGNENGKKAIGLDWQKNNFARASRFLYISLPSRHDYNVKMPIRSSGFELFFLRIPYLKLFVAVHRLYGN